MSMKSSTSWCRSLQVRFSLGEPACRFRTDLGPRHENDSPGDLAPLEHFVGTRGVGERKDPRRDGGESQVEKRLRRFAELVAIEVLGGIARQGEPVDETPSVEPNVSASDRAHQTISAAVPKSQNERWEQRTGNNVEHCIDALRWHRSVAMMSDDVRSSGACDEDRYRANTPSRTRDEHRLSGEDAEPLQAGVCGHAGQTDPGERDRIDVIWQRRDDGRGDRYELRITAITLGAHAAEPLHRGPDAIAHVDTHDIVRNFDDLTHHLEARNVGKTRFPPDVPVAGADLEVRVVDGGGEGADSNVASLKRWQFDSLELQDFGWAGPSHHDGV